MIEGYELDQIIGTRNQFGPNRYQVISESLFFEKYELIEQATQIIREQKDKEAASKVSKNDPFMTFAMNILQQQVFMDYQKFNSEDLDKYRLSNQTSAIIIILNKLIKEYIEQDSFKDQQQLQKKEFKKQDNNIIIIELEKSEIDDIKRNKYGISKKEDFFINLLVKKSRENLDFWDNQNTLKQVYLKDIQKLQINTNETIIYATRKYIQTNDIRSHFEQKFIINKTNENEEELCQDTLNNPIEKFTPIMVFNKLFTDQTINPILELSKYNRQVNFEEVKTKLCGGLIKPIDVFFLLIKIFEDCKQIIRWNKLLERYLKEKSIQPIYQPQKVDEKIEKIYKELMCYKLLDKRFQDQFHDIMKAESYDLYIRSIEQMEEDYNKKKDIQQIQQVSNTYFSIVLYEIKENGITLYQSIKIGLENFKVLTKLDFNNQKNNENSSSNTKKTQIDNIEEAQSILSVDQLSLVDREEGKTVYTLKFQLKPENQQLVQNQNEQYRDLIMEVLMKCVNINAKKTMYNPTSRNESKMQNKIQLISQI